MPSRLLAAPARLKSTLGYRLHLLRGNFGHHLATTPGGHTTVALFGQAVHATRLIADYLGQPPAPVHSVRSWRSADLALDLARQHGLVVFKDTFVPRALRSRLLHLPAGVDMARPVAGTVEQARAALPSRLRNILKNIEAKGLRLEVTRDPALLPEFHARYYAPAMHHRHGDRAYIYPLSEFLETLHERDGELWRVFDGDRWIAGILGSITPGKYTIEQFGWLDADPAILKAGALKLLYWQAITRATALGLPLVHFGGCPNDLLNGIVYQKSQWGGLVVANGNRYRNWSLLLEPGHPAVRAFLERQSPVFLRPDGRCYALSARDPADVPSAPSQFGSLAAWYRLRATPHPAPFPSDASSDLPEALRPWFDSLPIARPPA